MTVKVSIILSGTLNDLTKHLTGPMIRMGLVTLQEEKHKVKLPFINTIYWPQHIFTDCIHHGHHNHPFQTLRGFTLKGSYIEGHFCNKF